MNFQKYEKMRDQGGSPKEVYLAAKKDGLDFLALIRLLRKVFSLSFTQAKEVTVIGDGLASSLDEHQGKFIPGVKRALEALPNDENSNRKKQGRKSGIQVPD